MQKSRKVPTLVPIAAFVAALAFGLTPSLAQNRGGGGGGGGVVGGGAGYGDGAPHGDGGYSYGSGGYRGTTGLSSGGGSQSLRSIFHGPDSGPSDQLRERKEDQQDFLQKRTHKKPPPILD